MDEKINELVEVMKEKQRLVDEALDKSDQDATRWQQSRREADLAIRGRDVARMRVLDALLGTEER